MTTLTVTPNPATPGSLVAVAGSGFVNQRTRLSLDGVGTTVNVFKPRKDGTFNVGITVSSTPKTQILVAEQLTNGVWTEKARTSIVVQAVVPPPPPAQKIVNVKSIAELISAMPDDTLDRIVMAAVTLKPGAQALADPNSLWIDARFAARTRPLIIDLQASTADGQYSGNGFLRFVDGCAPMTWLLPTLINWHAFQTGIIFFGVCTTPPKAQTLILPGPVARAKGSSLNHDQGVYFSRVSGSGHVLDGWGVQNEGPMPGAPAGSGACSAVCFEHDEAPNAQDVTIRNLRGDGLYEAVSIWSTTAHGTVIDGALLTNSRAFACRYEGGIAPASLTLRNFVSTGSAIKGFGSNQGPTPAGVVFGTGNSFQ